MTPQNLKNMLDFVSSLTINQIEKYVKLTEIGVGPDAGLNAYLVCNQVDDLLGFIDILKNKPDDTEFSKVFHQIKFYLEQEHRRLYAGWLLDENNIHNPGLERIKNQLAQLQALGKEAGIHFSKPSRPSTPAQRQHEHDSYEIAALILNLALEIKKNPSMEFPVAIPKHAQAILRKNATDRYCSPVFSTKIEELHKSCSDFLKNSELKKSKGTLLHDDAVSYQKTHLEILKNIPSPAKKAAEFSIQKLTFFSGLTLIGSICVYSLLAYFNQAQEDCSQTPWLKT